MKKFSDFKITSHQLYILLIIKSNPEINLTSLSNQLNLAKSSVCIMADKLVKEGYVVRKENKHDRRNIDLTLSEKGEKIIAQTLPIKKRVYEKLLSNLTKDDLNNIKNSLKLLYDSIQANSQEI